ncbi:hypothetical protein OAG1_05670 [Agarivorans sp. OAG1]|uniref:hypothetical protein n=1 Tax=unclassified Agarivorans TaxID=2636026 RepID=UPI002B2F9E5A|nr:hypothetical protein OAG1_05670 [Agarivorans sp. OAG1]
MDIGPVTIVAKGSALVYQVDFDLKGSHQQLWFEVDNLAQQELSSSSDTALMALLLPAMLANENIHVKGSVSERLLFSLNGAYQTILTQTIPYLQRVNITAEHCNTQSSSATGVITGFSAGVDSFCTITDYFSDSPPKALKITHLLYNNVGSHGPGEERLFRERYQQLKETADTWQLPFITVNSNMNDFYGRSLDFQLTHTLRNAAIPMLFQQFIGHFLYSSAYSYQDLFVGESYDMAYSDAFSMPLLATESLQCHSVGSEHSRVEKTLRISSNPDSYKVLDVCVKGDRAGNCSHCDKCLRTLLTLDLAGKLELYKDNFDLEVYQQHKQAFINEVLISKDPLLKEIVVWAKQRGYRFAAHHYLSATMLFLKRSPAKVFLLFKNQLKKLLSSLGLYHPKQYH